jgi:UDP-3-O-[3-hydroxymyristoyl] glucosamine N-acyltransferase
MIGVLDACVSDLIEFCEKHKFELSLASQFRETRNFRITAVAPIDSAEKQHISFCRFEDERASKWISSSAAGFVFVPPSYLNSSVLLSNTCYIFADHPRLAILDFIREYWIDNEEQLFDDKNDVHPNAKIGPNVKIGKHCAIGSDVEIGGDTIIGNNTTIMHAKIGERCLIGSCVTIGGEGFGFEDKDNEVLPFPHLGSVIIGDDVRIGSSTCIDRASLGNTIIEDQVKIDNLVHVAHNVVIGRAAKVIAMTIIGGSTKIGKSAWVAPGASLRDWITVGENSLVGMGAVVTRDVDDNQAVVGNPARVIDKTKKRYR